MYWSKVMPVANRSGVTALGLSSIVASPGAHSSTSLRSRRGFDYFDYVVRPATICAPGRRRRTSGDVRTFEELLPPPRMSHGRSMRVSSTQIGTPRPSRTSTTRRSTSSTALLALPAEVDGEGTTNVPSARMASSLGDKFSTLHEIVRAARNNLAPGPWDYLIGGAETETTLRRNRQALDAIAFRPRVLRDVSKIDATSTLFGRPVRLPLMLAPIGSIETFAEGGGATAAKASEEFGVPQMLSSVCNPGLEAVAAAANNFRIFQLYVRGDDAWVDDWVRRAVDHGYAAFCLTVDTASYSRRERDLARRFVKPWRTRAGGFEFQAGLSWDHVKRFKDTHAIPLVLKGIATAEDAALAVDHGVEGVYVSNHGGRQLDHGRGAVEVLPEVVRAVGGRATVVVDGGFVRGTDVVKAIALGAQSVGIGRLACCGLAAAGQAGLVRVLELLDDEIRIAMALLGVDRLAALDPSYLHPATPVGPPRATSAVPLPDEDGY